MGLESIDSLPASAPMPSLASSSATAPPWVVAEGPGPLNCVQPTAAWLCALASPPPPPHACVYAA